VKRRWSRERWFFVLLTPIYVALVAYGLAGGGFAPELPAQAAGPSSEISAFELVLPTTDPSRVTPAPTQAPPGVRRKLDVNQADAWMLTAIPGIGEALAERIIAYRDSQGGLVAIEELNRIDGIGQKLYATLVEYVEVR